MDCPFCGGEQIFVVNSRPNVRIGQIWRRRKCGDCGGIFTTYEKVNLTHLFVIKRSGKTQKYSRAKLYSSIYHSAIDIKHADRGEMGKLTDRLTNEIERKIILLKRKKVMSEEIMELVLDTLVKGNWDIFLRFLAYREGKDKNRAKKILKKYLK